MEAQTQTADLKPNIKYVTDNFKYRQLRIFRRCDAIRYAPCVTSSRRLSPPDALGRCADLVHQAVLQNFDSEQSSVETSQSRRDVSGKFKTTPQYQQTFEVLGVVQQLALLISASYYEPSKF